MNIKRKVFKKKKKKQQQQQLEKVGEAKTTTFFCMIAKFFCIKRWSLNWTNS